ncbi:lysophospholipid acyltransferase family protein [Pseudokineococcus lusitanus]|uniref:1-acyl-sn-glycerol-3-phosphate acyltransferase n=1 Tax=Pseudokineococcus lusitanus TaxID=763993 RepID=A0A3N1HLA7_9ACTN|nr:lysophospholipid acyltransferase family protein [Pseudokineococcus lusitanus]ROP43290.1 1-acyl-sn-glycerol-3-phosphate acyltransferase [Pseudokineococcus lusitanus]
MGAAAAAGRASTRAPGRAPDDDGVVVPLHRGRRRPAGAPDPWAAATAPASPGGDARGHVPPPDPPRSDPPSADPPPADPPPSDDPADDLGALAGAAARAAATAGRAAGAAGVRAARAAASAGARAATSPRAVAAGERAAAAASVVGRRVTGDYEVDEMGFDRELTDAVLLDVLRPLYRRWFRVEVRGAEHVPATGGALLVSNHSGTVGIDALMTMVAVHDDVPGGRHLRVLAADLVLAAPVLGDLARRSGATLATPADADRLLAAGELVGVWPEGYKGVGKHFRDRYRLQRFGRGGFVASALRAGVPIVPVSVVGAEEVYPRVGDLPALARLLGVPYVPVTPFFPLLGPLGLVPLPTRWTIELGEPVRTDLAPPGTADDPAAVLEIADEVRETIQRTLHAMLLRRRSVFR